MSDWELVAGTRDSFGRRTHRLRVDGGWLYLVETTGAGDAADGVALCFVPLLPGSAS